MHPRNHQPDRRTRDPNQPTWTPRLENPLWTRVLVCHTIDNPALRVAKLSRSSDPVAGPAASR